LNHGIGRHRKKVVDLLGYSFKRILNNLLEQIYRFNRRLAFQVSLF
jgi:hypothetical protein